MVHHRHRHLSIAINHWRMRIVSKLDEKVTTVDGDAMLPRCRAEVIGEICMSWCFFKSLIWWMIDEALDLWHLWQPRSDDVRWYIMDPNGFHFELCTSSDVGAFFRWHGSLFHVAPRFLYVRKSRDSYVRGILFVSIDWWKHTLSHFLWYTLLAEEHKATMMTWGTTLIKLTALEA